MLESVVEKFGVLMGAHRGEIELVVTSAAVRDFSMARGGLNNRKD